MKESEISMLVGAIDRINRASEKFVYLLGGWAYFDIDGTRSPVEFSIKKSDEIAIRKINRLDCPGSGSLGFEMQVKLSDLVAVSIYEIEIEARFEDKSLHLRFLDQCLIRLKELIIEDFLVVSESPVLAEVICRQVVSSLLEGRGRQNRAETSKSSGFQILAGSKSIFEDAVIGRNGDFFLFKGANNLHAQYTDDGVGGVALSWLSRIRARFDFCRKNGIGFIQVIVPEKQSVHCEDYPFVTQSNTKIYVELARELRSEDCFVDVAENLRAIYKNGGRVFRKIDTHFSVQGLTSVLGDLLGKMGYQLSVEPARLQKKSLFGDLGNKFFRDGDFVEDVEIPSPDYVIGASSEVVEVGAVDVPGHIGTARSWRNDKAVYEKRVLIFGNSCFERGMDPLGLSYWFCRLFREVRFIWAPDFQQSVVDEFKPDFVICQTVERFLKYVPNN